MAVENVISGAEYVVIANHYGNLRRQLTSAANYLYSAVYKIVQFNEFEPTLDLLNAFYETYTLQTQVLNNNTPYIGAVRALNAHVVNRAVDGDGNSYSDITGGLSAIDQWLDDEGVADNSILEEWQTMSTAAGFAIDDGFVI
jgi:hypothetical protein